jgi:hypothetical protein
VWTRKGWEQEVRSVGVTLQKLPTPRPLLLKKLRDEKAKQIQNPRPRQNPRKVRQNIIPKMQSYSGPNKKT